MAQQPPKARPDRQTITMPDRVKILPRGKPLRKDRTVQQQYEHVRMLCTRVPVATKDAMDRLAVARDQSLSALLRELISYSILDLRSKGALLPSDPNYELFHDVERDNYDSLT